MDPFLSPVGLLDMYEKQLSKQALLYMYQNVILIVQAKETDLVGGYGVPLTQPQQLQLDASVLGARKTAIHLMRNSLGTFFTL